MIIQSQDYLLLVYLSELQKRFDDSIKSLFLSEEVEATFSSVALAISGGSDSMAMLHLASNWAKRCGIHLVVFSINHNLRESAAEEINFVRKATLSLGHEFYKFSWDSKNNKSAIQERARFARYEMMTKKCHDLGINILLTAHHLDDMLETYMMRLDKKSGILGLSYTKSFFHNNIWVFRPLADFLKTELIDYLTHINLDIKWMEDESNSSDAYERNRVRKEILSMRELEKQELINQMHQVNEEARALNQRLIAVLAESVEINNFGFAVVNLEKIRQSELDIKIHIINYLLTIISGKTELPRFRSTSQIINKIENKEEINSSLHGCLLKQTKDKLLILREASQIKEVPVKLSDQVYWDERFIIECNFSPSEKYSEKYSIEALKLSDYIQIKDQLDLKDLKKMGGNSHKLILFTLPVIKNLEKTIAIPHISYYDEREFIGLLKITFRPNFISRFTHFL